MISNTSGAGLGLSIVKKLADLMNGTIEIDSEPGEGTAIKILFTFFRAQEKAGQRECKEFSGGHRFIRHEDSSGRG